MPTVFLFLSIFLRYVAGSVSKSFWYLSLLTLEVMDSDSAKTKRLDNGITRGQVIGKSQSYARTLANRPANVINPPELAAIAKGLARASKRLSCTVFDEKQMKEKGMDNTAMLNEIIDIEIEVIKRTMDRGA